MLSDKFVEDFITEVTQELDKLSQIETEIKKVTASYDGSSDNMIPESEIIKCKEDAAAAANARRQELEDKIAMQNRPTTVGTSMRRRTFAL